MNKTTLSTILKILEQTVPAVLALLDTQKHTVDPAAQAEHVANLTGAMGSIADLKEDIQGLSVDLTPAGNIRSGPPYTIDPTDPGRVPSRDFQYVQPDDATEPTEETK
jgi:hypothetical protein